jgi:hypothetical protein
MNTQIVIVLLLNFIISIIGTLAYSVRLVGVRTGKIAISSALFSILALVSRTALSLQTPLLTKYVERNHTSTDLMGIFYTIILVSGIATVAGAFLIPTFQRLFYKGVLSFSSERSLLKLILHSFSKSGIKYIRECAAVPMKENITRLNYRKLPKKIMLFNAITVSLLTVGSLAPIYAGSIDSDLRATCITLSAVINGVATILMAVIIDPQLSIMTDDVIEGKCAVEDFRTCVIGMVGSKTIGTFASLLLVLPASYIIVFIARVI